MIQTLNPEADEDAKPGGTGIRTVDHVTMQGLAQTIDGSVIV